jgi:transposase
MLAPSYFVGLDLDSAARQFDAAIGATPWRLIAGPVTFADSLAGFREMLAWLHRYDCAPPQTVACMQAAGFLGEPLAYFLAAQGYGVAIEPLARIRRAFRKQTRDLSKQDSAQVAEYASCCLDDLRLWQPRAEQLEQVQALLARCERLSLRVQAVDDQVRCLLKPRPTVADEWPWY